MRIVLGLGIVLVAAGVTVSVWASHLAREVPPPGPVAEFRTGLHFFVPPANLKSTSSEGRTAEPSPPGAASGQLPAPPAESAATPASKEKEVGAAPAATTGGTPSGNLDFQALFASLKPEDVEDIRRRLEPVGINQLLAVRLRVGVAYVPDDAISPPRSIGLAVVSDADADRCLAPLAGQGGDKREAYLGTDAPLGKLLSGDGFPRGAADVPSARLPASARCFADMVLVRESAAARLGLAPQAAAPNLVIVALDLPGRLEDAMRLVWPLWQERGISARPIDWHLDGAGLPRCLGTAAIALLLAGGSLLVGAGLVALGQVGDLKNAVLARLLGGVRMLADHRQAYGRVLAAMTAALILGAVWGGPAPLGDFARETAIEPLASVGLESAGLGPRELLDLFLMTLVTNVLLWGVVVIAVPSLAPGVGLVTALAHNLAWGVVLAPATLTLLDRLPLRAAVVVVEGAAYAILALGAWRVLAGVVWPQTLGCETRRQGYAAGMEELYRLVFLAAAVLAVAALMETGLMAALSHWR